MSTKQFLTASEAAQILGISLPTLYAYVSRGLIRSEAADQVRRTRRYSAEDVERLRTRQEQRRDPDRAVDTALHWGTPLLDSELTLILDGTLYYRGQEATYLAETATLEEVAALFWAGDTEAARSVFGAPPVSLSERCQLVMRELNESTPMEHLQTLIPLAALDDLAAYDIRPATVAQTGARLLRLMTAIVCQQAKSEASIAEMLQRAWLPDHPDTMPLLQAALILCADHELNISSFTARCVASAGSTPYAVVTAGLAALQGYKHGGNCERVEAFWREVGSPTRARAALTNRVKRGESVPGFGHTLYPAGDPRARFLLGQIRKVRPDAPAVHFADALIEAAHQCLEEHPNIDFALVVLCETLQLPSGTALALFALGRTVGWLGHALEAYETNRLIRPRARYIGKLPEPIQKPGR